MLPEIQIRTSLEKLKEEIEVLDETENSKVRYLS
jgi:hypothetical protein